MMTDPLGDMLARIRNAGGARHAQMRCPASKLKLAVARVLAAEGFVGEVRTEGDEKRPTLEVDLRYQDDGQPDDRGDAAGLEAGPAHLSRGRRIEACACRSRHVDPVDFEGRDVRSGCTRRERRRRSDLRGLVGDESNRKSSDRDSLRRDGDVADGEIQVKGPKVTLRGRGARGHPGEGRGRDAQLRPRRGYQRGATPARTRPGS